MSSCFFSNAVLPSFALALYVVAATAGAFLGGLWAALGIGGALLLFVGFWAVDKKMPLPQTDFAFLAFGTLWVAAILNFQSSQPDISWSEWVRLLSVLIPLLLFSNPSIEARAFHKAFVPVVLIAAMAGALALGLELSLGAPLLKEVEGLPNVALTQYNRGLSYLILLAFPLMAGLRGGFPPLSPQKRAVVIAAFILALLIPAGLTESRAAKLALVLALAATVIAYFWPVLTRRLLAIVPFLCLGWPLAAQKVFLLHQDWVTRLPNSWRARMEIWDYMSYRIMERPLLGWGLGTAHTLPFQEPHGSQYVFVDMAVAHPHNVVMQLWVELGLPGLALGLIFALLTLRKAGQLDAKLAPFAIGAWVAALCLSLVAYNFWTDSLWAAFAMTGFAFAMLEKNRPVPA